MRPVLIDFCCKAGGTSKGYDWAGFDVLGIDIEDQPNYPYPFLRTDGIDALKRLIKALPLMFRVPNSTRIRLIHLADIAAFHASPPCLGETTLKHLHSHKTYPDLIGPFREQLEQTGRPYVIENVSNARKKLRNPVQLCGTSFGLGANGRELRRHRLFECNFPVMVPPCQHTKEVVGVYGTGGGGQMTRGYKGTPEEYREAMGIDWATRAEIAQAIPPDFTEHLGGYLLAAVNAPQELAA